MKPAFFAPIFVVLANAVPLTNRSEPVFLVDSEHHPHVAISWPTKDGIGNALEAVREYLAPNDRTPLGKNLSCYVGLGGNRGDLGLGRPGAVDVRVGFYKVDKSRPLFENMGRDLSIL